MSKDYYKILGVQKNASKEDIKRAFRKLAHEHHPDKKSGNEEKFKEVNEAYSVLSDDSKRQQYDTYGSADPNMGGFGGGQGFGGFDFSQFSGNGQGFEFDLGDIFGDFFGGRTQSRTKKGRDISVDVEISFSEAIFGVERDIELTKKSNCQSCKGSGAKNGTSLKSCPTCKGQGKIQETKRTILGSYSSTKQCPDCHGKGEVPHEKCHDCHGHGIVERKQTITVKIPSGMNTGEMIRLTGAGEAVSGGVPGDLYIRVHIEEHKHIKRDGYNLTMDIPIKLTEALLGTEKEIETLDGNLSLKIPSGVSHHEILRIKGKGVPIERSKRGDLLVRIKVIYPSKLSKSVIKLVEELKEEGL